MIMEKAVRQQICSKLSSSTFATLLPIIPALLLLSLFFFFPVSGPSPFLLTLPIALLSTLFLVSLTKKKRSPDENLVQGMLQKEENVIVQKHEQQSEVRSDSSFPSDSESSSSSDGSIIGENLDLSAQKHEQQKLKGIGCSSSKKMHTTISECLSIQDHQQELNPRHFGDSSFLSDCDSSSGSAMGRSLELDHNRDQNLGISNNFASDNDNDDDEDSLIEINLLSSDFSGFSTEENKQKVQPKLPDFLPESIFKQQDLMELLAEINEMNEDENLIEIDISSDSTKCQGLRLKRELSFLGEQYVLSD